MKHNTDIFYDSSCRDREFDDYLLLGGGTDISPALYGETNFGLSQYPDQRRDFNNMASINKYVNLGKPIFGICRGLQIMDAAFGGKLIQHTVGHPSGVTVDLTMGGYSENHPSSIDKCRNCHHQVVDLHFTQGVIIGQSNYEYKGYFDAETVDLTIVPQIVYWPEKKALAVQFHPEWQGENHKMNIYLRGLIKELLGLEDVL